jgi:small conductance mechanosensitive channel
MAWASAMTCEGNSAPPRSFSQLGHIASKRNLMYETLLDPYRLIQAKLTGFANQAVLLLPNIVAALAMLLAAWAFSRWLRQRAIRFASRRNRADLGDLFGSIAALAVMTAGIMIAASIVFPGITPGSLFASLGIGSVAIGFAFRDILQNLFAGVLIIVTRPFRRGDYIATAGFEGIVEDIQNRATLIRQADNRLVLLPNSVLYVSPVVVDSSATFTRDEMAFDLLPNADPQTDEAETIAAVAAVKGVLAQPAPRLLVELSKGKELKGRIRWFTRNAGAEKEYVRSRVARVLSQRRIAALHAAKRRTSPV